MLNDMKPSHLLLIFLSGSFASVVFGPIVSLILSAHLTSGALVGAYRSEITLIRGAGAGESVLALGVIFFTGLLVDAVNILSHNSRFYNFVYRWTARRWGYAAQIAFIDSHHAISAVLDRPDDPTRDYIGRVLWLKRHPEYAELRGWEWFLTQAFDLSVVLSFWYSLLSGGLLVVMLCFHLAICFADLAPPLLALSLYLLFIPGATFHRHVRARADAHLTQAYIHDLAASPHDPK